LRVDAPTIVKNAKNPNRTTKITKDTKKPNDSFSEVLLFLVILVPLVVRRALPSCKVRRIMQVKST